MWKWKYDNDKEFGLNWLCVLRNGAIWLKPNWTEMSNLCKNRISNQSGHLGYEIYYKNENSSIKNDQTDMQQIGALSFKRICAFTLSASRGRQRTAGWNYLMFLRLQNQIKHKFLTVRLTELFIFVPNESVRR